MRYLLSLLALFAGWQPPARPQRIVSLVPAVTEMIYAMGDGARVAAVSNYDRFPPTAAGRRKAGGWLDRTWDGPSRTSRMW